MSRGDTSYRCTRRRLSGDEESMMIARSFGGRAAKFKAAAAALLAAAVLVTSTGSLAFSNNKLAYAADLSDGALCTPTSQSMGTEANPATERDSGVATWVGGDMYVGKKSDNLTNAGGPDASYSVEAEGLTVVNGKLMLHPQKNSWNGKGFRFGIAGFGTQYRPAEGSTALVVGGNTETVMDSATSTADVKAWNKPGFIDGHSHVGSLSGSQSDVWGGDGMSSIGSYNGASVNWQKDKSGNTQNQDAGNLTKVSVKATDGGAATDKAFSKDTFYQGYVVDDIVSPLAKQNNTGTVSSSISTLSELPRHKYNYAASGISYTFKYNDDTKSGTDHGIASTTSYINREKLITFTGTNNASMEVFNLNASMLSDTDEHGTLYRGVGFAFTNIADTASVVINVTGNASDISFHNGWQFWWNGAEISDGYSDYNNTDELKKKSAAYDKASQKILWNFSNTDNLTIYGGVANEDGTNTNANKITQDDAAAAMMGSIIVRGNFESHVSTNGRVYTGGDFSMYNPYRAWTFNQAGANDGDSASVLDMDQERHNFPWNGSYTESCSAIAWQKADESGTLLGGTTWAVYGKYDDAASGKNALLTVQDNAFYDKDSVDGRFTVEGLKPNATYYIKEVSAGNDYQLNTNVYYVATGDSSATPVNDAYSVTKTDGTYTYGKADMTDDGKIVNKKNGHEVSWSKVDADTNKELAGSQWQIQQVKDGAATKSWNVTDNTSKATGVTVNPTSAMLDSTNGWKTDLTAAVDPKDALQEVAWTFTDKDGNAVDSSTVAVLTRTGNLKTTVIGISSIDTTVYVKACSVSNPEVCSAPVTIKVKAMNVKDFTVKDSSNRTVENNSTITADDPQPSDADGVAENAIDDGAKAISCTAADGENGQPGVKCDMDTAAGKFKVGGLDAGTYWLHETTAPYGYTINKTLYQFTIDANGNTWNGGWASGEATGAIDEKLKPGNNNAISDTPTEVTWNKVDTKGGKLAGSQWKIVGPSPATDVYCVADNVTVDANGATTPAGIEFTGCTGEKLSDAANTADEAGVITVRGLPVGTYTLTETKAPDGYVATTTVYTLTISDTKASTVVAQTATDRPTTRSGGNREAAANVPNASAPVNIQIPVKKSVKYTSWPKDSNGNYVNFNFKIEATKSTVDANPAAPMPAECSSSDATKNDCTISLAPKSDADDLSNVIAKFGKMTFTDANLAAAAGDASDYAKTYTYKITEIVPDSADAVENLRYSKAEYQVVVTVKQAKDSSGKLSGLSVSATMTRIKDDSGNAEAGGGKVIGTWSSTSTGSSAGTAVEATFVNTKVLTGLPTTGADWTGRLVLLVGDGFILAGVLIAGGYQLAKRRREEDSD